MSLIIRYRPKTLDDFVGNKDVVNSLVSILTRSKEKLPHSFMFTGPPGCGKTTLGRIVARSLEISKSDLTEIDTAQYTGIDGIRELRRQMQFRPIDGERKLWILDECHRLSGNAQDSLLKALEEPPGHVFFVLCTTDPKSMRKAVIRRCSYHEVNPLSEIETLRFLLGITKKEDRSVPKEVLKQIAQDSLGQPGTALQILDKVIDLDEEDMLEVAKQQAESENQIIELCRALIKEESWSEISRILRRLEDDPESIRRSVLGYCNTVLLKGGNSQAAVIIDEFIEPFYNTGKPGLTLACYKTTK